MADELTRTGSITKAVTAAKTVGGFSLKIEVECGTEEEADEAIRAGADIVMLDNFSPSDIRSTSARLKDRHKSRSFLIEISGGLTPDNLSEHLFPGTRVSSRGLPCLF